MGQCYEKAGGAANAEKYYQAAIKHKARKLHEVYQRLANLLRDRLSQPDAADEVIEEMVESDLENYQVYLERGRYRRRFEIARRWGRFSKGAQKLSSGKGEKDQPRSGWKLPRSPRRNQDGRGKENP